VASFTSERLAKVQIFKDIGEAMPSVRMKIFTYSSSFYSLLMGEQNELIFHIS